MCMCMLANSSQLFLSFKEGSFYSFHAISFMSADECSQKAQLWKTHSFIQRTAHAEAVSRTSAT